MLLCIRHSHRSAFSLVELSIVLVILGLLVGGVLSGQSLIHGAEMRSVTSESNRYQAALNIFRDKYFALPGDMTNATAVWGKDNALCPGNSGTAATPGTCNGDGDGKITYSVTGTSGEEAHSWQQLARAGLIEGTYSGTNYPINRGVNIPASRIANAAWALYYSNAGGDVLNPTPLDTNHFVLGAPSATWNMPGTAIFKPEDAWNIDTKMDDGQANNGVIQSYIGQGLGAGCSTGNTYTLSDSALECYMTFAVK